MVMKNLYKIANRMMIASVVASASSFADVVIDKDTTLAGDVDFSGEVVTVSANATLNLAGYELKAAAIAGGGTITSARMDEYVFSTAGGSVWTRTGI